MTLGPDSSQGWRLGGWCCGILLYSASILAGSAVITHCPTNRIILAGSQCLASLEDLTAEVESSEPGAVASVTQYPLAGTGLGLGTNLVTLSVTDTNDQTSSCVTLITVVDATPPVIEWYLTNVVVAAGLGCLGWMPDLTETDYLVAADNCSSVTVTQSVAADTVLVLGTNEVVLGIVDEAGNAAYCTNYVVVADQTPPIIVCYLTNVVVPADTNCQGRMPDLTGMNYLMAVDNCSSVTATQSVAADTVLGLGTNEVVVGLVDTAGNTDYYTNYVVVVDQTPPVITGPADLSVGNDPGQCGAVVTYTTPEGHDNCSGAVTTQVEGLASGSLFPVGRTTNTFQVTDSAGYSAACSFVVTVADTEPPVISWYLTNVVVVADTNCQGRMPDLTGMNYLVAVDNCSSVTATQSVAADTVLGLGTNEVVGGVVDTAGNTAYYTNSVMVVDTTPPVLTCAANKSVEYTDAWTFEDPGAMDACGTNTLTALSTTTNWACGAGYMATRVWQAVDAFANSATCTQIVTVVDTTLPVILCPSNFTVECSIPWSFGTPVAADKGLGGVLVYDNSANDLATRFEVGTNEAGNQIILAGTERYLEGFSYEFWSTNLTGASSLEGTNVTVRLRFYANDGTNFNNYPTPGTLLYDSGEFWLGTWTTPRATVVYDEFDLWLYALYPLMDALPPSFTWTVQFDGLGANDRIGVDLYSPPVVGQSYGDFWLRTDGGWELRMLAGVAADIAARAIASTNRVVISVLDTVTNAVPGGLFAVTRTWRATDACGNSSDCSQTVTVADTTPPLITVCPPDRSLSIGANCLLMLPDCSGELIATDACGQVLVSQSPPPGTAVGLGQYVLTFTASDTASNTSTCTLLLNATSPPEAHTNISLSEFMAKNVLSITDETGTHSDWIEIHNAGSCPVNLDGWCLTDDVTRLTKWRFPATNISGGQFIIVWASDKNRRVPGAPLHTNFKMGDEGEYLALVQPDGTNIATQFYPTFPPQLPDVSYGMPADGATNAYLASPTPAMPNSAETNFNVADLSLAPGRGWYTNSVAVSIGTPTAGATLYYTTNGTVPSPTNGLVYTGPLVFTNTTVLRAAAYRPAFLPALASHTYVFPQRVIFQTGTGFPATWGTNSYGVPVEAIYKCNSNIVNEPRWSNQIPASLLSLPTMSVAMNTDDLFGTNGIYSNPYGDGDEWERPCSVEYFRPDSQPGFQINCGIQIQGSLSRDPTITPKHNFRLKFKQMYGSAKLLFDLYPGSPVSDFDTLVLHASLNDHWFWIGGRAQLHRDQWCADTQQETGGFGTHGTYVNLYVNGLYWGLYNLGERPDASYAAHYLGGQKSDYDAFNFNELKDGTTNAWSELLALVTAGVTNDTTWSNVCYYLDVPSFIDYLLINFYAANQDWPLNNYWKDGAVARGVPFHLFSWDAEESLWIMDDLTDMTLGEPGVLYSSLRQYPEFRRLFGDHAQQLLFNGGALTPQRCAARWMKRAQEIDLAMVAESARWGIAASPWEGGGMITHDDWIEEQTYLLANWFPQRTDILIAQLRNTTPPMDDAPVFTPHNGIIAESLDVVITATAGTLYYTTNGSDPRLPDGGLSPDALVYESALTLTRSVQLRARAFVANTWSALAEAYYPRWNEVELEVSGISHQGDGSVKLDFVAWPGVSYTLRAATSLNSAPMVPSYGAGYPSEWEAIATLVPSPDGTFSYVDTTATNYSTRFYRLTWP